VDSTNYEAAYYAVFPLSSKYSPQHRVLENPQSTYGFFPLGERPSLLPIQNKGNRSLGRPLKR